ncbi:MAG: MupG family TIM beta-alpha barrel fold protein [Peptoniphilaceae bacterium]|nr:MupG family TIM beta-alpha barrel fold protein [Peptoniphilaceae bacterium]MDY6018966.1 MupG family TIM beta-alpha barrel fold protein [Anaerococcus sp.]
MLGFSIYLHETIDNKVIKKLRKKSVKKIFTTCHMPEYDFDVLKSLSNLFEICKANELELFADLDKNFYLKNKKVLDRLLEEGLGLRLDYGFSLADTISLSKNNKLAINASTLRQDDLIYLENNGVNKKNLILWHNFYPKKYSGLSKKFFTEKNEIFRNMGYKIYAFVSGNENLRPPMKEYLPTLEELRGMNPFVAYLKMLLDFKIDCVFVSEGLKDFDLSLINLYEEKSLIKIPVKILPNYKNLIGIEFTNRFDQSTYLIRAIESRKMDLKVKAENTIFREIGSITLDNKEFKRYEGELNIVKRRLEKDIRVNVIGEVRDSYKELVNYIGPGGKFILDEKYN